MTEQTPPSHSDVIVCPGGPMLIRGQFTITDRDGEHHESFRPVSAVCRCGHSANTPWCDGTHKKLPVEKRPQ